ncbi:MAG: hypothetical protein JXA10_19540 [Anaerolineae bacterium]|nr:hypothetical protein [Anaerolineae bacterium]
MRTLTCEPTSEVRGDVLLSLLTNLRADNMKPYLKQFSLDDIHANEWYPTKNFLDMLNELSRNPNLTPNYVAIGLNVPETAYMPPELENASFADVLEGWDNHYQSNHRHADIGHKIAEKVHDQHYKITMQSIYPDDMEYGVLYGFAKRFLPSGTQFTVWYDEDEPRMDQGGTQTVIHVSWH